MRSAPSASLANVATDALLPYVTSDSLDMAQSASIAVASGELALTLAPTSVTTLVGNIKTGESAPPPVHKVYLPYF